MSAVFNHKYYGWYEEKEETFNTGVESRLIKVKDNVLLGNTVILVVYRLLSQMFLQVRQLGFQSNRRLSFLCCSC